MSITLHQDVRGITARQLRRLHVGWPNPPSPDTFYASLSNMNAVVLALDEDTGDVVGFVCGMTDRTLILYIWDLEVLPEFKAQGLEKKLLTCLLDRHGDLYQVNANPHPGIQRFFSESGFAAVGEAQCRPMTRMSIERQNGLQVLSSR